MEGIIMKRLSMPLPTEIKKSWSYYKIRQDFIFGTWKTKANFVEYFKSIVDNKKFIRTWNKILFFI